MFQHVIPKSPCKVQSADVMGSKVQFSLTFDHAVTDVFWGPNTTKPDEFVLILCRILHQIALTGILGPNFTKYKFVKFDPE